MLRSWTQILSIYVKKKKLGKETQVCGTKIGGGGDGDPWNFLANHLVKHG